MTESMELSVLSQNSIKTRVFWGSKTYFSKEIWLIIDLFMSILTENVKTRV